MCKARVSSVVALGCKPMRLHKLEKCPYGCIREEVKQLLRGELKSKPSGACLTLPNRKSPRVQTLDHHLPPTGSS